MLRSGCFQPGAQFAKADGQRDAANAPVVKEAAVNLKIDRPVQDGLPRQLRRRADDARFQVVRAISFKRIHINVEPSLVFWGVPLYRVSPSPSLCHIHPLCQYVVRALGFQLKLGSSKPITRHDIDTVGQALYAATSEQLSAAAAVRYAEC